MTVQERFIKYAKFSTASDENGAGSPTTPGQRVLGAALVEELKELGLENPHMDENGYVYGWLPATPGLEELPCVALIAHMDTSPDAPGENVSPRVVRYEGGDLTLENGTVTDLKRFPYLADYAGQELIVTDGNTLLGADDKAGIAEIMAAAALLVADSARKHGRIALCFTPDEEIGSGADLLDLSKLGAQWGYTVDGGELGEIEYENFNAASAKWVIHGVNIHPGEAKNKMKNAALLAVELVNRLPAAETPAHTEKYEGFYHVNHISGDETEAQIHMIIRDHDMEKFLCRKEFVTDLTAYLNKVYGEGTFELTLNDSYYNRREKILPHMHIIDTAKAAMEKAGVTPKVVAIRGGTDGARLSFRGLPCPNLSTGGMNFHGVNELIPVNAMDKMVEVLLNIVTK